MLSNFYSQYPFSNAHEMDLDWLIRTVKRNEKIVDDFTIFNTISWAGEWDASKSYVKWCVVQDNTGNGYISIQPVPTNVPLTNTDYWVQVANYMALYTAFNTRISDLENTVGDNTQGLVKDVDDIQTDITNINDNIDDIEDDINTLFNPVRRYIVISDSYGLGRGGATGWTELLEGFLNAGTDNWYTWSEGSMGVYHVGDNGHNAEGLLTAHAGDITSPETITDIVFGLGINDETDTAANIEAAFRSLIAYCNTTYPKAKVWFGHIGNRYGKTVAETYTYIDHLRLYEQLSSELSVSYITGVEYIMHNRSLCQADNVHPTTEGATQIAKYVNGALHGMVGTYTASRVSTLTAGGNTVSCPQLINGPMSSIYIPAVYNSSTMTFSGSTPITFGTFTNWLIDFNSLACTTAKIYSNDNTAPECCTVLINDNTLYIAFPSPGSKTVAGVQLNHITLTVPTLWC